MGSSRVAAEGRGRCCVSVRGLWSENRRAGGANPQGLSDLLGTVPFFFFFPPFKLFILY